MIEKMKKVHIVTSVSGKEEMLNGLRDIGVVHIAERKAAERTVTDRFQNLSRTEMTLKEYADPKQKKGSAEILKGKAFEEMYEKVREAIEEKANLTQEIGAANMEIDRISAWGDFSPEELSSLKEHGFDFHFYRIGEKEFANALQDENIRLIRLGEMDKQKAIAVIGTLPPEIQATEFAPPEKSLTALRKEVEDAGAKIAECDKVLKDNSVYDESFKAEMIRAQNSVNFSEAEETLEGDTDFVWISGYIPEDDTEKIRQMASAKGCAFAIEDVAEDDETVPTKVRYSKISGLIKPVFDILGILPGYREQDISLWFFLFFTLFFAMIIGDGAYGVLILIATVVIHKKQKKLTNVTFLLYVLSIGTIIWGAVTGTWFGLESAMETPLRYLVIPRFASYPQYFGYEAQYAYDGVMKFSFTIGAIQMALGALLSIRKKLPQKDLSWVADLGWMVAIIAMYFLSLNLVIGENIPMMPVFVAVGIAFLLVVLFGGMSPDKTFGQGLKSGLADAFTVFLNTISCFGNVMSYIRLFAVGMAGVAISQSFNSMAGQMSGPLLVAAVLIVVVGHGLNIIMCFLSVVVHGVRLNVLEFSGQAGLEWTGIAYEPFKKIGEE
ncbi:MAG: hypothetical protein IJP92_11380 [Lachnospiraceae bacterium]|nr:hypothetical protein [Lachnospiraceae bacterium]